MTKKKATKKTTRMTKETSGRVIAINDAMGAMRRRLDERIDNLAAVIEKITEEMDKLSDELDARCPPREIRSVTQVQCPNHRNAIEVRLALPDPPNNTK